MADFMKLKILKGKKRIIIKTLLIFLIGVGFLLPNFAFLKDQPVGPPKTLGEAKEMGLSFFKEAKEKLPGILAEIWKGEVLPFWRKMFNWFKENIWPKILSWFKKNIEKPAKEEIEKRKEIIKEELKKEAEETKKEIKEEVIPKTTKSLWEKFKELLR